MDVIFNDYSVHEQYKNIELLIDDLYEFTLFPINILKKYDYELLGSFNTYNNRIIPNLSINRLFQYQYRFPELSKIKSILIDMIKDPYWETDVKTDSSANYYSELIEIDKNKPNAITESVERDKILLSLHDDVFDFYEFCVKKNNKEVTLKNINSIESVSKVLFCNGNITFSEMLQISLKKHNVIFCKNCSGKYYADFGFEESGFSHTDGPVIMEDLFEFIEGTENGNVRSDFHDSVKHKGITYYEFRTSLSQHRLFRMYYCLQGNTKCFINSHAKKTQTIPDRVKDNSVDIIKALKL